MECFVEQTDQAEWDAFVNSRSDATFFHLWSWRDVLARSFGYRPAYITVKDDGGVQGILPLFLVRSILFGRSVVSIPLGVYGGPIATSHAVERLLLDKAEEIAYAHDAKYLEVRGNPFGHPDGSVEADSPDSFKNKDLYVTFLADIDPDPAVNLSRVPRKQRRMIRQGEKYQLKFIVDQSRLRDCYDVYAASVRNLGTPVYPYSYFRNLADEFGDSCKVFLVEQDNKTIAGVLTFFHRNQVLPYYGGARRECFHLAPNDFMYWELMRYSAENGYRIFDFGRSKIGSGSFDFKRHWGFEARPLPYAVRAINGHTIPDTSPRNPKLQWAIRVWRNLPLGVTNTLGPHIARHIP